MRTTGHQWKLADPRNPYVKDALNRTCPFCDAPQGKRCVTNKGKKLGDRLVHYARVVFPAAAPDPTPFELTAIIE
jgi:hypothetical protein